MKVLDPQSALLTTVEVHQFLSTNPPREPDRRIGSYQPINLQNYHRVRQDFEHYINTTTPHIKAYPPAETWMKDLVARLRKFGLTKTEVFTLINLGVGLHRTQITNGTVEHDADHAEISSEPQAPDDRQLISLVVEELDERFPGDEGERQIQEMMKIMRDSTTRGNGPTDNKT